MTSKTSIDISRVQAGLKSLDTSHKHPVKGVSNISTPVADAVSRTCILPSDAHPNLRDLIDPPKAAVVLEQYSEENVAAFPQSASSLPMYREYPTVIPAPSILEKTLAHLTIYEDFTRAETPEQFESIFRRLQQEWIAIGGLLTALAAMNLAVLSTAPDSIFNTHPYVRDAIATSSVSSGLGIACVVWFLFRYSWASLETFTYRAQDLYNSYIFFSISSRVPTLCMMISSSSFFVFLAPVAFNEWPEAVISVTILVGFILNLQFVIFGAQLCWKLVASGCVAGLDILDTFVRFTRGLCQ